MDPDGLVDAKISRTSRFHSRDGSNAEVERKLPGDTFLGGWSRFKEFCEQKVVDHSNP